MRWRTLRWKAWDAKCSCGNIALRCPRHPHWRWKLAAHGNFGRTSEISPGVTPNSAINPGFGLRSVSGESGAEGEDERLAHRSRSATSRRRAADGSPPLMAAHCGCPLVTSARFVEWNGRRREGDRDDGQPVERSKPRVGHGGFGVCFPTRIASCSKPAFDSSIMATTCLMDG